MSTKLSDHLRQWRAERPDEWKMGEFIRQAEQIENALHLVSEMCVNPAHTMTKSGLEDTVDACKKISDCVIK